MREQLILMSNCLRSISATMVERAKSGHPGMPLGISDVLTVLFSKELKITKENPKWINRDRFVLSAGHGSSILYAILHMLGYNIQIKDLKSFRQIHSKTPGHPEKNEELGIDMTTGPLGQGLANAVGIAISERKMNAALGEIINHKIYCVVGDGCIMEGISHESASLAGHLKLKNLIVLMDYNGITIDGSTSLTCSEDTKKRFESYMWHTQVIDGHNFDEISSAIKSAKKSDKPSIIFCKTTIGKHSNKKENSNKSHGSPLGKEEMDFLKKKINYDFDNFEIPEYCYEHWSKTKAQNESEYRNWITKHKDSHAMNMLEKLEATNAKNLNEALEMLEEQIKKVKYNESTRQSSGRIIEAIYSNTFLSIGGSSDLTESNFTKPKDSEPISASNYGGCYIHYGIREHAMAAIMNGIFAHSKSPTYGGTFLTFLEYAKPAIRMSAIMNLGVIYIATHDSIGVGEDGPTHQPVEQLAGFRSMPNVMVFRPSDALETLFSWKSALETKTSPSIIVLSRQATNYIMRDKDAYQNISKGFYVIRKAINNKPKIIIIATGTELQIGISVANKLEEQGISTQVVSANCFKIFDKQSLDYKNSILQKNAIKIAIEAGSEFGWHKYIGDTGLFIGVNYFGKSGKKEDLYDFFEINESKIMKKIIEKINER